MSAWIVTKKHIDYLVTAAINAELIAPSKADETGRMLWAENLKSVADRYPNDRDGDRPGPADFGDRDVERYQWRETPVLIGGALAKTVGCYDYQSCEHDDYQHGEAYRLVLQLSKVSGRGETEYPEEVPWGWADWSESGKHHALEIERDSVKSNGGSIFVRCICGWMVGWVAPEYLAQAEDQHAKHLAYFNQEVA